MASNFSIVGAAVAAGALQDLNYGIAYEKLVNGDLNGALVDLGNGSSNAVSVGVDMFIYQALKKAMPSKTINLGFMKLGF